MNGKQARKLRKKYLKEESILIKMFGRYEWEGGRRKYQDAKKAYKKREEK